MYLKREAWPTKAKAQTTRHRNIVIGGTARGEKPPSLAKHHWKLICGAFLDRATTRFVPKGDRENFGKQISSFPIVRTITDGGSAIASGSVQRAQQQRLLQKKAEEMLKNAEAAASPQARAEFLSLADHWHRLAQAMEKPGR
jgi:hypothetical protein